MWRVESGMRKAPKFVIARALCARGALSAKREEVPLGCNLGKALPEWERHRRPYMLPGLTVAALPERLWQLQVLQQ